MQRKKDKMFIKWSVDGRVVKTFSLRENSPEEHGFEPRSALASGSDGLDALREIASGALAHLVTSGRLIVEHGWDQGAAVRTLFLRAGLQDVHTQPDLAGHERLTFGRAP